jgi:hypothetical protein
MPFGEISIWKSGKLLISLSAENATGGVTWTYDLLCDLSR